MQMCLSIILLVTASEATYEAIEQPIEVFDVERPMVDLFDVSHIFDVRRSGATLRSRVEHSLSAAAGQSLYDRFMRLRTLQHPKNRQRDIASYRHPL